MPTSNHLSHRTDPIPRSSWIGSHQTQEIKPNSALDGSIFGHTMVSVPLISAQPNTGGASTIVSDRDSGGNLLKTVSGETRSSTVNQKMYALSLQGKRL